MQLDDRLDPELATLVASLPVPDADAEFVAMVRSFGVGSNELPGIAQTDHVVDATTGASVRVYRPVDPARPRPAIVWIHGGGYVIGGRDMADPLFARVVPTLGIVGISVEYRLAPEHPFPAPLDDCFAALAWTTANAEELGIDPDRIGIGGLSAGAGLAAATALLGRDRSVPLAFQLLEAPMLDDRQQTASSQLDGLHLWSRASNRFGWESYLGDRYGTDDVPALAAPARAVDLTGLPPTMVIVGELDGFVDEDVDYAMRLSRAGVPTELQVVSGGCHGYQTFADCALTIRANAAVDAWLARQVGA